MEKLDVDILELGSSPSPASNIFICHHLPRCHDAQLHQATGQLGHVQLTALKALGRPVVWPRHHPGPQALDKPLWQAFILRLWDFKRINLTTKGHGFSSNGLTVPPRDIKFDDYGKSEAVAAFASNTDCVSIGHNHPKVAHGLDKWKLTTHYYFSWCQYTNIDGSWMIMVAIGFIACSLI